MRGRPPKPTALKLLQGRHHGVDSGGRKISMDEPKPPVGAEMPFYLLRIPAAVENWQREAPKLEAIGVLTEVDAKQFARLCRLWAEDEAKAVDGQPTDLQLAVEIRQLEGRFGMEPSSRSKIRADKPKPATKLSKYTNVKA